MAEMTCSKTPGGSLRPPFLSIGRALIEVIRAIRVARRVERLRKLESLHSAVRGARALSAGTRRRTLSERRALRTAISLVDRAFVSGANCVRRSLMELALDSGAATESFRAGFRRLGGPRSGHAWLESHGPDGSYDAVVTIP